MAGALLAVMTLVVVAVWVSPPAQAGETEQTYECKSCSQASGLELTTEFIGSTGNVLSGAKGVCTAMWEKTGGGWKEYFSCSATGTEAQVSHRGSYTGHGQVRRYYKEFLYNLSGAEYFGCCSPAVSPVALTATSHRRIGRHEQLGFAVLSRRHASIASTQQIQGVPSNAVLAASVRGNDVYVFQDVKSLKTQTCIADHLTEMTAVACNSAEAAEREGVDLILPNAGNAPSVMVLVPNGVNTLTVTKPTGSTSVAVSNNVAVIEGDVTAYHYTTASGTQRSVRLEG